MGFLKSRAEEESMNTSLKLIAALAVLTGIGGSSAVAMQGGQQKEVTYFYDDEEHTNMVGGTLIYCDGSHSHWGSYTLYTTYYYFGCH
jgi:uncharacterized protein DUF6289